VVKIALVGDRLLASRAGAYVYS